MNNSFIAPLNTVADPSAKAPPLQPAQLRRIILEQSLRAGVGHIGSALSVVEILASLYGGCLRIESTADLERDRFILSKGHAALALYAALHMRGWIDSAELGSFCGNDSLLGVHPEHQLRGVDFSTGSLGQGLTYGVGAALAAKRQKSPRRVYVLLSDAECNEGAVWESAMFAAHHELDNLIAIIDCNRQQAFGYTEDVLDLKPLANRWQAFGWNAVAVDGHDVSTLTDTIFAFQQSSSSPASIKRPCVLVANTVFGKGVSFMEGQLKWHYSPLSQQDYDTAMAEWEAR
jgi:transketolase